MNPKHIAIQVTNLHKSFGDIKAVQGVSFEVRPGEIFGLLGPNGAGKTTTISMLATLLRPDEGDAWATDGFKNISIRGLGLGSVLLPASALIGYAVLFFMLAAWRFWTSEEH